MCDFESMNSILNTSIQFGEAASHASPEVHDTLRTSDQRLRFRLNALELNADLDAQSHNTLLDPTNTHSRDDHWILTHPTLQQMVDAVCVEQRRRRGAPTTASALTSADRVSAIQQLGVFHAQQPSDFWGEVRFMARFTWACGVAAVRNLSI